MRPTSAVLPLFLPLLACATPSAGPQAGPTSVAADALAGAPRRASGDPVVVGVFELDARDGISRADRAALHDGFVAGLREDTGLVVQTLKVRASEDGVEPAGVDEAAFELARGEEGALPDVFVWPHASLEDGLVAVRTEVVSAYGTGRATQRVLGSAASGAVAREAAAPIRTFISERMAPGMPARAQVARLRRAEALRNASWVRESLPLQAAREPARARQCAR